MPVPPASAHITAHIPTAQQASDLTMDRMLTVPLVLGGQEHPKTLAMVHIMDHHTVATGPALARLVAAA